MNKTIMMLRVARSSGYVMLLMICVRVMAQYLANRLNLIVFAP